MSWQMWLVYIGAVVVSAMGAFLVIAQIVNYLTLTPDGFISKDAYQKAANGWTMMILGGGIVLLVIFFCPWKHGLICRILLFVSWLAGGAKALEHYFWMRAHGVPRIPRFVQNINMRLGTLLTWKLKLKRLLCGRK